MNKLKLGVQLYSVRNGCMADMPGTLKKVAAMGYEGVEFFGAFYWPAEEVKKAAEEAGVTVIGWHVGFSAVDKANIYATIAYAKAVGMKTVTVPGLPPEMTCDAKAWHETAAKFNEAAKIMNAHGIRLGYHNHAAEFTAIEGNKTAWDIFMSETCSCITGQLDNGNALSGGGDPLACLKKYPQRAYLWHLKPYSLTDGFATMLGEDSIDWKSQFDEILAQGVTEWSIVEYECAEKYEEFDGVKRCYDNIRAMGY